jgi:hypothetical protein
MLFDRLRITQPEEVGYIWSRVMQRVYDVGGLYTLNLHPERGILCQQALETLLSFANRQSRPIWIARLSEIAQWWKERSQFRVKFTARGTQRWLVEIDCSERAVLLTRHVTVEGRSTTSWSGNDERVSSPSGSFTAHAVQCPCIALSARTAQAVEDYLHEQGYPTVRIDAEDEAENYALYLDMPDGLGKTRTEQMHERGALVDRIERLEAPLLRFGCWPDSYAAALAITGDIDSVTVQDFFLRIIEVYHNR